MFSYSLWHLVGNGAAVLKGHGVNIVLNLFFGPTVNAARAVANQVDGAVNRFASNFMMAMNPQITQSYDYSPDRTAGGIFYCKPPLPKIILENLQFRTFLRVLAKQQEINTT